MIAQLKKRLLLTGIVLFLFLLYSSANAFIPEGSDIIKLTVEKIVEPVGMTVIQKRKVYHKLQVLEDFKELEKSEKSDGIKEFAIIEEVDNPVIHTKNQDQKTLEKTELSFTQITEKLWFSFPGKYRSESITGAHNMICVESGKKFVKVVDEFIDSKEKSLTDLHTDILLCRKPGSLQKRLKVSGVDTNHSSFKRRDGKIYFVVGIPPTDKLLSSSFWVEKETSFPGRYTVYKNDMFVDILYNDWQKVSRTWYPMQITIFLNGILFSKIDAEQFKLKSGFKKKLFNIKRIMTIFPQSSNYKNETGLSGDESGNIEKSITEFKKIYE